MKTTIRAENDSVRFTFPGHTIELQNRVSAWFSARLAELQEPLRTLVARRLFIHHEGRSFDNLIRVEFSLTFQRTLRIPDDGRDYSRSSDARHEAKPNLQTGKPTRGFMPETIWATPNQGS